MNKIGDIEYVQVGLFGKIFIGLFGRILFEVTDKIGKNYIGSKRFKNIENAWIYSELVKLREKMEEKNET